MHKTAKDLEDLRQQVARTSAGEVKIVGNEVWRVQPASIHRWIVNDGIVFELPKATVPEGMRMHAVALDRGQISLEDYENADRRIWRSPSGRRAISAKHPSGF